jgi:phage-related protein
MHMTFNGTASNTLHLEHCVPLVPLLSERTSSRIQIPGRDGFVDFNNDSLMPRLIPVDCLTDEASSEAELAKWMEGIAVWLSGSGNLIFDTDTGMQWKEAKIYQMVEMEHHPRRRRFTVTFECQPYAEAVTKTTGAAVGTATDYGSDVEFYPEITVNITGATESVQVSLLSTGEFVQVVDSLVDSDVIVFNMATGKVTKNGASCMDKVSLTSLFFGVPPGEQTITVTADSTYTATMDYYKRYKYARPA